MAGYYACGAFICPKIDIFLFLEEYICYENLIKHFGEALLLSFLREIRKIHISQHTTNPTIRLMRPAKTQIRLRIRAVWSEHSLIACAFYFIQIIQRGMNVTPWRIGWMYRLIFLCWSHRSYRRFWRALTRISSLRAMKFLSQPSKLKVFTCPRRSRASWTSRAWCFPVS